MIQFLRLHLNDITRHPAAFKLENPGSMPTAKKPVGFFIIYRDIGQVPILAMPFKDQAAGVLHHLEGRRSQEVNFEQAHIVDDIHFELHQ